MSTGPKMVGSFEEHHSVRFMRWLRPHVVGLFRQHVAPRIPRVAYLVAIALVALVAIIAIASAFAVGRWVFSVTFALLGAAVGYWRAQRIPRWTGGVGGAAGGFWLVWAWGIDPRASLLLLGVLTVVWFLIGVEQREPVTMPDELCRQWRRLTAKGQPLGQVLDASALDFDKERTLQADDGQLHYTLQVSDGRIPGPDTWRRLESAADKILNGVARNSLQGWPDDARPSLYHVQFALLAHDVPPTEGGEAVA